MQQTQHLGLDIILILVATSVGLSTLFIYCFFGRNATDSFEKMALDLFHADWPTLPHNIQKYFLFMVMNAQRPHYYHGYNMTMLNLETFGKVCVEKLY